MASKTEELLVELLSDMKKRMEKLEEKVEDLEARQPTEIHNHYHSHTHHHPAPYRPYNPWWTGGVYYGTINTSGTATNNTLNTTSNTATIKASDVVDFTLLESKAENSVESTFK